MPKAIISWSGGKDSALALWKSRDHYDIAALVTTVTETFDRISMHGVRRRLLELQAAALGIPLHVVSIPWPCPNEVYEARMRAAFAQFQQQGVDNVICGDIFLEDVRRYREERLLPKGSGVFPLWGVNTRHLIQEFLGTGFRAILCCVDTQAIPGDLAGRLLDRALLADLPPAADPCGENGEYHSFVFDGPGFSAAIPITVGERVLREGRFMYCDLVEAAR